ncbi:MAG: hypothetical protein KGI68_14145 [Alphaproteobacteria bacterium]|nr:hypothetical protein [Alphaproteobacteria bacterium]MDE2265239.1 hypothetical protein [Alphaproteobacteria bacterium]
MTEEPQKQPQIMQQSPFLSLLGPFLILCGVLGQLYLISHYANTGTYSLSLGISALGLMVAGVGLGFVHLRRNRSA